MVNGDLPCTVGRHIVKLGTFEHRSTNFEHYLGSCNKPLANKKSFGKCLRTESLVVYRKCTIRNLWVNFTLDLELKKGYTD